MRSCEQHIFTADDNMKRLFSEIDDTSAHIYALRIKVPWSSLCSWAERAARLLRAGGISEKVRQLYLRKPVRTLHHRTAFRALRYRPDYYEKSFPPDFWLSCLYLCEKQEDVSCGGASQEYRDEDNRHRRGSRLLQRKQVFKRVS